MGVNQTPTGGILDGDKGGIAYLALPSESQGVEIEFTPAAEVEIVENVFVEVSSTPTFGSFRGAKNTRVPTTTAPLYF